MLIRILEINVLTERCMYIMVKLQMGTKNKNVSVSFSFVSFNVVSGKIWQIVLFVLKNWATAGIPQAFFFIMDTVQKKLSATVIQSTQNSTVLPYLSYPREPKKKIKTCALPMVSFKREKKKQKLSARITSCQSDRTK